MSSLVQDRKNKSVQVFATTEIISVTSGVAWTPPKWAISYCVPVDCSYTINGSGNTGTLNTGATRGITSGYTYTFDTDMNIEVM